ncbi:MAG: hypothetical protein H7Y88_01155 [Phycisphaerales bacterium]|nr:hypothetical protein [Phycisphaerales bacterium]
MDSPTIRDEVRLAMNEKFGKPLVLNVESGAIYRWVLKRERGPSLYITLDAPELPALVHLLISDPLPDEVNPISAALARTWDEAAVLLDRIMAQWKRGSAEERGAGKREHGFA